MPEWVLFFAIVVGVPVVFSTLSDMHKRQLRLRERQMELTAAATAEQAAQYAAKIERLEARVAVLERIATDRGADLALEIEKLRTAPLN
jgi:ABC-type phosphate transport system auxiliary subunit